MSFSQTVAQRGINSQFEGMILQASSEFGVEVPLIKAIISTESAWNPNAVNAADPSYGLMQLNAHYFHGANGEPILDPEANIATGTQFLADLKRSYGSQGPLAVISAYNAGHPIAGNAPYVNEVLAYYQWFSANDPASGGITDGPPVDEIPGIVDATTMSLVAILVVGVILFAVMRSGD